MKDHANSKAKLFDGYHDGQFDVAGKRAFCQHTARRGSWTIQTF